MAMNVGRALSCMRTIYVSRVLRHVREPVSLGTNLARFSSSSPDALPKTDSLEVTFVKADGQKVKARCKEGDSLLDVVVNNELDISGYGACEGTLTCSTCHVILSKEDYDRIPSKPLDDENDMLDLAFELTETYGHPNESLIFIDTR
ncbi:Adrenodoxin, mitochondrial [Gryllus bimaculatus]|nr:Adrenodoxin, mitochondrial [Gryllus bimaculatus]